MPLDGQRQFVGGQALTVVGHQDTGQAAAVGLHLDAGRPGVEGVFHQLLDRARRAFHHLAGGDAIDGLRRQATDRHVRAFSSAAL